ncbi:MAG: hypothetical protein WCC90_11340 [Methylocella sp.]
MGPLFKSAERLAARQVRIDSPPTPNGQSGRKQICSPLQYLGNDVAIERPGLGVFGPGCVSHTFFIVQVFGFKGKSATVKK